MDYTREGGYYYPMESGPDKDEEEEINGMVVHEKGRNTVRYEFLSSSYLTPPTLDLYPSTLSHDETAKGKDGASQWVDYQFHWAGAEHSPYYWA